MLQALLAHAGIGLIIRYFYLAKVIQIISISSHSITHFFSPPLATITPTILTNQLKITLAKLPKIEMKI